jgi:hypothetical protein
MALQFVLASTDDLPDNIKPLYKKRDDGKFQLDTEGVVDKSKLDEFRSSNVQLKEQVEKLTADAAKFKDIDPDKYKQFLDKFQSDEEKKLIKEGNIEGLVSMRTDGIKKNAEEQIAAKDREIEKWKAEAAKATTTMNHSIVESQLLRVMDNPDLGFHPRASELLLSNALKEFVVKDGKPQRINPATGATVFGKEGNAMGLEEYVASFAKDHPYLVKPSNGGGAHKGESRGGAGKKSMSRSEFAKLDPAAQSNFVREQKGVVVDA